MNKIDYFNAHVKKTEECWLWDRADTKGGYGRAKFNGKRMLAHRFAWEIFYNEIPKGLNVCHKCDVPLCVNPDHLFIGSQLDNMRDAKNKKRLNPKKGINSYACTLAESVVMDILLSNLPSVLLAKKHGLKLYQISSIRNGKSWKHLSEGIKVPVYIDGRSEIPKNKKICAFVSSPENIIIPVRSISLFAKENKLCREGVRRLIRGIQKEFKGWKLVDLETTERIAEMAELMVTA